MTKKSGFTLIELLVVIGILAILAGVVIVAVNPARQFAQTRNTQRQAHVTTILNAINQNMVENNGVFTCDENGDSTADPIPTTAINLGSAAADYNIVDCIVPTYVPTLPFDPSTGNFATSTSYDTQYEVMRDAGTGQITVNAPDAELGVVISETR